MKQKNSSSNLVTKEFLKDELIGLVTRVDIKLDRLESRIDKNARNYRDQILTSNDKLAQQLETMREELGLENLQIKREVENHEKRTTRLEKIPQTA